MKRQILGFMAVFAVFSGAQAEERVVYEGVFDIPLVAGSFVPDDCFAKTPLADAPQEAKDNAACVAFPYERDPEQSSGEWDYVRALDAAGWKFAGGAGNAYTLEKVVDADCSRQLYMIGQIQGDPDEVAKWGRAGEKDMDWSRIENSLYLFIEAENQVCGEKRTAR